MKENESALYSRYVIDGLLGEATPAELLNECMEYPFDDELLTGNFKDIVDETIEPPLSASTAHLYPVNQRLHREHEHRAPPRLFPL